MRSRPALPADLAEYARDLGWGELWIGPRSAGGGETAHRPGAERGVPPEGVRAAPAVAVRPLDTHTPAGAPRAATASQVTATSSAAERGAALVALAARAQSCEACRLAGGRSTVVFGSGNPDADLMFVGEGPGAEEDRQGLPFVGPAGALLTKIIGAIGMQRDDVYIANVVKCRPPGNRDPLPDEVVACRQFLRDQLALVRPRVIVGLGRVAAQALLGRVGKLGDFRGTWHNFEGVALRITYHPAALLRDDTYKRPTWEDMKLVRDRLNELPPRP